MKNKSKFIILALIMLISVIGISYAFFVYYKVGDNSSKLIFGDIYLKLNSGSDSITLLNVFPETKEKARSRTDNQITFTVSGINTTTNKDIWYEIMLNEGNEVSGRTRFNTEDLVFDLIEVNEDNTETYLVDAQCFDDINAKRIWVETVNRNTTSEVNKTYKLRMWLSEDVFISDTNPNATYDVATFESSYASVKVSVYGDFVEKKLPLGYVVYNFDLLNMDNELVPFYSTDTEIKVIDSMNSSINPDFLGWSTIEGGQVEYQPGDSINVSEINVYNFNLYPVMRIILGYVIYDMSGLGLSNLTSTPIYEGQATTITTEAPVVSGYNFVGWSTTQNGEVVYRNGDEVDTSNLVNGNITLYPVLHEKQKLMDRITNTMPLTSADSEGTRFVTGKAVNNNYVWYSGKLWRIVSIDKDGNIKLVTQGGMTSIAWNTTSSINYSESQIFTWLNNEFLPTLYDAENLLLNSVWDYTTYTSFPTTRLTTTNSVTAKVGLLNIYEYKMTGGTNSSSTSKTFLNNGYECWTMSQYSGSKIWYISYKGDAKANQEYDGSLNVHPSINLKSGITILGGTGEKNNPYTIDGDKTVGTTSELLSNRISGEYINFNNTKYRIVGIEMINGEKLTKVTMADYDVNKNTLTTSQTFGLSSYDVKYTTSAGIGKYMYDWYNGTSINSVYKDMIATSGIKWYTGPSKGTDIYYTKSKTGTTVATPIGLGYYGEMFSSQFGASYSNSTTIWLMTRYSDTLVWYVENDGYTSAGFATPSYGARPSFYLKADVKIVSGNGQLGSPYEIAQ